MTHRDWLLFLVGAAIGLSPLALLIHTGVLDAPPVVLLLGLAIALPIWIIVTTIEPRWRH